MAGFRVTTEVVHDYSRIPFTLFAQGMELLRKRGVTDPFPLARAHQLETRLRGEADLRSLLSRLDISV